jgi:DNA topoisomerase I
VERDLGAPDLRREKVLATVVRLLDTSALRVGNREYARDNNSFGLTTLRNRHARVEGAEVRFRFRGKGGKDVAVALHDRRVAAIIRRLQDLPGQHLFRYHDDQGELRVVTSGDVNGYLQETMGEDFTAKDFRTWAGTVLAATELSRLGLGKSESEAKHLVVEAVRSVAGTLGNTPAVCRRCYVHPAVIDGYLAGRLVEACDDPDDRCERAVLEMLARQASAA